MFRVLTVRHHVILPPKIMHSHAVVVVPMLALRVHQAVVDSAQAVIMDVVHRVVLVHAQEHVKLTVKLLVVLVAHHVLLSAHTLVPENAQRHVKLSVQISALAHVVASAEMDVVEIAQEAVVVVKMHVPQDVLQHVQTVLVNALVHAVETVLEVVQVHAREPAKTPVLVNAKQLAKTLAQIHVRVNVARRVKVNV